MTNCCSSSAESCPVSPASQSSHTDPRHLFTWSKQIRSRGGNERYFQRSHETQAEWYGLRGTQKVWQGMGNLNIVGTLQMLWYSILGMSEEDSSTAGVLAVQDRNPQAAKFPNDLFFVCQRVKIPFSVRPIKEGDAIIIHKLFSGVPAQLTLKLATQTGAAVSSFTQQAQRNQGKPKLAACALHIPASCPVCEVTKSLVSVSKMSFCTPGAYKVC